jgi:hypothetical protein
MISDEDSDNGDVAEGSASYRTTTFADRYAIFMAVRSTMVNGRVKNGIHSELGRQLGLGRVTVSRQWAILRDRLAPLLITEPDVDKHPELIRNSHALLFADGKASRKKGKYKYDRDEVDLAIKAIPVKMRRSVRKVAMRIGMAKSTVNLYVHPRYPGEEPLLRRAVSKLKPTLTDKNKEARYTFALDQINMATAHLVRPRFLDLMDRVHIDEKWFHMCQDGEGYLLCLDEEPPERHVKHKGYIGKVMFLCAQARPRWNPHTNTQWDGKIGIWPIGNYTTAKRNSKHRPAGTTEWENHNVDHELYRDMMVDLVFTEIMNKWPVGQWNNPSFRIRIQQDGAGGHTKFDDVYLSQALEDLGLADKISIYTQPPNSPDLNILDLGLFNALQCAYYDHAPRNEVELITMVEQTYGDYPHEQINRLFITLQTVFNSILANNGCNQYKLTHMNKARLEREGRLPVAIVCTHVI